MAPSPAGPTKPRKERASLPALWEEERSQCVAYLAVERSHSENSQWIYLLALERFARWFERRRGSLPVGEVTRQDVEAFLEEAQKKQKLSPSSIKILGIALKHFFRFLLDRGRISSDPTALLPTPKVPFELPRVLSQEEVKAILELPHPETPLGLRDRAILELFYTGGLRLGEIVRLRVEWLFLDESFVRVLGKGNRERIVPIGRPAVQRIQEYLERGRPSLVKKGSGGELFLGEQGKRLTPRRVYSIVRNAAERAGIQGRIHPHLLRHSFATHLLSNGADLRVIQELLGHASLATTERYTHVEAARLIAIHRKFHPRSSLGPLEAQPPDKPPAKS
jgi:integrase/recombinase XerD